MIIADQSSSVHDVIARSMRVSLVAFVFVSASLLLMTWIYLRGYSDAPRDVTITPAAATSELSAR